MADFFEQVADMMMGSVCFGASGISRAEVLAKLREKCKTEAALAAMLEEGLQDFERRRASAEQHGKTLVIAYPTLGIAVTEHGRITDPALVADIMQKGNIEP